MLVGDVLDLEPCFKTTDSTAHDLATILGVVGAGNPRVEINQFVPEFVA